jgi:RNA polymerase sigma factor (sigma-70 family)
MGQPRTTVSRQMGKLDNKMPYGHPEMEKEIVEGCLRGDAKSQKLLFEKYYGKMLAVCQRYSKNRDEAKDVLQEGFVKVFQKLEQYSFNSPFEAWVRRIMVNTAIDFYRKAASEPIINDIEFAGDVLEHQDVISDMTHAELMLVLQQLPAGYKIVFNMYAIEGFSHKEIAETLKISEGTSKSQLAKARVYLQKLIGKKLTSYNG